MVYDAVRPLSRDTSSQSSTCPISIVSYSRYSDTSGSSECVIYMCTHLRILITGIVYNIIFTPLPPDCINNETTQTTIFYAHTTNGGNGAGRWDFQDNYMNLAMRL